MAIGYHSRAFHGTSDPTSTPTSKKGSRGHIEVLAARDKKPGMRQNVGMPRGKTLRERSKGTIGEGI
jgi:hypothetical protein